MSKGATLYERIVTVTEDYLGPAGERFIRRQITTHLDMEPEKLDKKHLPKLIDWSSIAFAMVTKDSKDRDAFTRDLQSLAKNGN